MKSKLYKATILFLLVALIGTVAFFGWPIYLKHAKDSTLETVGRRSREITAVEVLQLSSTGESGPSGSYLVGYNNSPRGIAARHTLTGVQASELVRLWSGVRFIEGYLAGCHAPGFVLRFLVGERCIFEAAVCFECENVSWQPAPFSHALRQMTPDAIEKKSGIEPLKTFLTQLSLKPN